MTTLPALPEDVVAFVASDPAGPRFAVRDALCNPDSRMHESFRSYLSAIPPEMVAATLQDPQFCFFAPDGGDLDHEARIWLAERLLTSNIPQRRNELVRSEVVSGRPRPYNLPVLSDVQVDSEHLVRLSAFRFDGSRLLRNGYAFTVLCTTGSPNSTYWLLNAIYNAKIADRTSVRLDPFLCGPEETFSSMSYKMWIYGRPIDWDRIANLQASEHGRWHPGPLSRGCEFTDFVWTPRSPEVHFIAEEVPTLVDVTGEAARYVHAVYVPAEKVISHFDGALRLYTGRELRDRHEIHVRNAGKVGVREKVFRMDIAIPRESFSSIVQAFYVWNQDVGDYFTSTLVDDESRTA